MTVVLVVVVAWIGFGFGYFTGPIAPRRAYPDRWILPECAERDPVALWRARPIPRPSPPVRRWQ